MILAELIRQFDNVVAAENKLADAPVKFFDGSQSWDITFLIARHRTGDSIWIQTPDEHHEWARGRIAELERELKPPKRVDLARLAIERLPAFASLWPDEVKVSWFSAYAACTTACRSSDEAPTLLRALESVEAGLYAEWLRADGLGKHLAPLLEVCWKAITEAGGDSLWSRRPNA
jgi:hypothetical protein